MTEGRPDAQQASRRRHWQRIGPAVALLFFVGVVIAIVVTSQSENPAVRDVASIPGVAEYEVASRDHVEGDVEYDQTPSVGGSHSQVWTNCGAYRSPVVEEQVTHSMEHGAVWIAYTSTLERADVERLETLVANASFAVLSPADSLPAPVVASAWGLQLQTKDAGDRRLATFLREFQQGPQTPELGAPCTGGADG